MASIGQLEDTMIPSSTPSLNIISKLALTGFLTVFTTALVIPAPAQTPSFLKLGQMPGVWPAAGTYSSAISGDGSTIMGYGWVCANGGTNCSSSDTVKAYRWTSAGGYKILGSAG